MALVSKDRELLHRARVLGRIRDLLADGAEGGIHGRHVLAKRRLGFAGLLGLECTGGECERQNGESAQVPETQKHGECVQCESGPGRQPHDAAWMPACGGLPTMLRRGGRSGSGYLSGSDTTRTAVP